MSGDKFVKKCVICGDKAYGYNFNAITCESCKVMFRRNALNYENFKCNFRGNCRIDVKNRKYCKRCRLAKCFAVGMKKDNIMNDQQKQIRVKKIEQNRQKRHKRQQEIEELMASLDTSPEPSPSESMSSAITTVNQMDLMRKIESMAIDYERLKARLAELELSAQTRRWTDLSYDTYQKAVELEFTFIPIGRPLPERLLPFNELELNRFRELLDATAAMSSGPTPPITRQCQKSCIQDFNRGLQCARNISRIMAIYVERVTETIVKMSKNLTTFNALCENDQIILVKYACFEICVIRAIPCYNFEYQYWNLIMDDESSVIMKLDLLKRDKRNIYQNYKTILDKLGADWDSDLNIINLLTAIILFNPDRPDLIHGENIRLQQHIYVHLLQRYLLIKYGSDCVANTKFLRIMSCLSDLNVLNNKMTSNWLDDQYECIPLMNEIVKTTNSITITVI